MWQSGDLSLKDHGRPRSTAVFGGLSIGRTGLRWSQKSEDRTGPDHSERWEKHWLVGKRVRTHPCQQDVRTRSITRTFDLLPTPCRSYPLFLLMIGRIRRVRAFVSIK